MLRPSGWHIRTMAHSHHGCVFFWDNAAKDLQSLASRNRLLRQSLVDLRLSHSASQYLLELALTEIKHA
jgi:hypothetical protein